ncbi:M23 family metallopeptidase [Aquimarina sp. 2201CG14-23]|uniref:M23 family metallopeptidase n=1 Tax=Aquimarina mycalae TaxID=3040073 RepID=UPI00247807CE|nr:M23 family metallopeptidase [Aquimarina sp. 2201CG14-23]MDH7448284.1 M23 family metallopeptidase [Aquimarina sp. 2201CG14-23]
MKHFLVIVLLFIITSCRHTSSKSQLSNNFSVKASTAQSKYARYDSLFKKNQDFVSINFDFPVGKPDAKGYYNAQRFQENHHLGDDWNGVNGGNSDIGDAIYAIANGYVASAKDIGGGWGNVIRVIHKYKGNYYESVYAHCQTIKVSKGEFIKKGKLIASIGNANGIYLAHLHLEIRDDIFMDIGGGYSKNTKGYLDPTKFINEN